MMILTSTLLTFLVGLIAAAVADLVKRDARNIVVPLTYEPASLLLTAAVDIGTPATTYNLIVDTGSPFIVVQKSSWHVTQSTWDPADSLQPDMSSVGGYMTTTPIPDEGGSKPPEKISMHFLTDSLDFVEGSGMRAGEGAKKGNVTVGLTQLADLKKAQGILGLSPPFSAVKSAASSPPPSDGGGSGGKGKRAAPAGDKLPSLDVSFLHSYLSEDHRKTLGMTGSNHFYLSLAAPAAPSPPSGELVFPLTGTSLPKFIPGYDYSQQISIAPETGSTFPRHPFWGIAHRPDLAFALDGKPLPDVRIDGLLLDSGTSGIVGPPSEVSKVFAAVGGGDAGITPWRVKGSPAVLGKTNCGVRLDMGFAIGDKQVRFEAVRQKFDVDDNGHRQTRRVDVGSNTAEQQAKGGPLTPWKSYIDSNIQRIVSGWNGLWGQPSGEDRRRGGLLGFGLWVGNGNGMTRRKRHHHHERRTLEVGFGFGLGAGSEPNPESGGEDNQEGKPGEKRGKGDKKQEKQCDVTLMGSPEVEKMFPPNANGEPLKVWILGMEFFQQNLVYHNIDTAQTVLVPRTQPSAPWPPTQP